MFSVIIPVYNGAHCIDGAVKSVLAQTEKEWEIVIVNDGSTDDTLGVLKKYEGDGRIRVYSQPNAGVSAARNKAMSLARYGYYAFLDADDVWDADHLETMRKLIKKYPGAGLYASAVRVEMVNGKIQTEYDYFRNRTGEDVFLEDFLGEYHRDKTVKIFTPVSTCVTREAMEKTGGFPVGCKIGEDLEMDLRVAAYFPVALTKKNTATYKKVNSTATKDRSFDPDWGFFEGVKALYADETIPAQKRENLRKVMDWFTMRRCRHYIIDGRRREAFRAFAETGPSVAVKDRLINFALLMMPAALVRRIFAARWRGKS